MKTAIPNMRNERICNNEREIARGESKIESCLCACKTRESKML